MQPIVTIIIPVYNRADLVTATFLSIQRQTLKDFECVIVDDRSTDDTFQVLKKLAVDDKRFNIIQRPHTRKKGAPTCRNIGLDIAQGETIVFFDSDDLMTPDHLEKKHTTFKTHKVALVVSKTVRFDHGEPEKTYTSEEDQYHLKEYDVSLYNYATHKINWLTPDTMILKELANQVRFNETLLRGQEYNFYCKLLANNPSVAFIDEPLTLRRMHNESIRSSYTYEEILIDMDTLKLKTVLEIQDIIDQRTARKLVFIISNNTSKIGYPFSALYVISLGKLIMKFYDKKTALFYLRAHLAKYFFRKNYKYEKALREQMKGFKM